MKKFTFLFAVLLTVLVCAVSCSKKDDDNKEPEKQEAAYPISEFVGTSWATSQGDVKLSVGTKTEMTCTYNVPAVSKNTDEPTQTKEVKITYTFDEEKGTFTGTDAEQKNYSGSLSSKTELSFTMPSGTYKLLKK